jgi:hypothetical protein
VPFIGIIVPFSYINMVLSRYHGKSKALMYDVTKIISMIKGKRGEHRLFRLAENLCMNLILSLRDFFLVKKELKVKYYLLLFGNSAITSPSLVH